MPRYKTHVKGGVVSYFVALPLVWYIKPFTILLAAEGFLLALAGSLFPDIDIKSKGQQLFYWSIAIACLFFILRENFRILGILSIISIVPMLVKHRGLLHRLWFIVGFSLVVAWYARICYPRCATHILFYTIFFMAGALSHLWLDFGFKQMFRLK